MDEYNIKFDTTPDFMPDTEAYAICGPDKYEKVEISALYCWVAPHQGEWLAAPIKVRINKFIMSSYFKDKADDIGRMSLNRLVKTEEEAKRLTQFHKVELTDEQWYQAIGDRDEDESLEDCELSDCCSTISEIRTLLITCKENKGLIVWETEILQSLLSDHSSYEQTQILDKIFKQLDVDWSGYDNV
jgi:hypothetical protein